MTLAGGLDVIYEALFRGEWEHARAECLRRLREGADDAALHHALGLSSCGSHAYEDALIHFEHAVRIDHSTPRWSRDAGALYAKLGRWPEALEVLEPFLSTLDGQAVALYLTASIETHSEARALARLPQESRRRWSSDPQALCLYGRTLLAVSRFSEAQMVLSECVALADDMPAAHDALARAFEGTKQGDRALEHRSKAAQLEPRSAYAQLRLALAYADRGLWEESRDARLRAVQLGLTRLEDHSSRLYLMLSDPTETAETILSAARLAFNASRPVTPEPFGRSVRPRDRRLRVGYLSGEFHSTPSYFFTAPFLRNHDTSAVEVFLYDCSPSLDRHTPSDVSLGEHYRDTADLSDAALRDTLRRDDLDVLVDLSGHFPGNRLSLLCDPAAPVQAAYPHYPATTGCPGIDYLFTDDWTSPPGSDVEYAERLYRLPSGCLAFATPVDSPPVSPSPCETNRHATFGVFQRLAKFNDGVWDALAAVLDRVPNAMLVVHNGDAELERQESRTARHVKQCFEERGIDPRRLSLRGPLPYREHLELVGQVDVALDTFPYTGQTTTCESLWMGVPVVTLMTATHVGRVSGALLSRAGHPEWVAKSPDEYGAIAESLAADIPQLLTMRRQLRADFLQAGLADGPRLARALETAYRAIA